MLGRSSSPRFEHAKGRLHPLKHSTTGRRPDSVRRSGGAVASLSFGDLRIEGSSRAGDETWIRLHPPGLAFDVGRGALELSGARDLFLSHGHLDHALGVPWLLSLGVLHSAGPTRVFCPAAAAADLEALIEAAARLEQATYKFELQPLEAGDRVEVGRDLEVEAFAVDHVVPALGYHLLRHKRRLAEKYRGLSSEDVARLKKSGSAVEEVALEIWVSYCGDTGPQVFELEPRLFESQVLLLECTFLHSDRRTHSADFKHIHFEDLVDRAERFRNRALVLHHLSRRHSVSDLRAAIEERLPALSERIHLLGG